MCVFFSMGILVSPGFRPLDQLLLLWPPLPPRLQLGLRPVGQGFVGRELRPPGGTLQDPLLLQDGCPQVFIQL